MMKKKIYRVFSLLLAAALVFGSVPGRVYAKEDENEGREVLPAIIHIGNAEELIQLAEKCKVVNNSKNMRVYLDKDIHLGELPEELRFRGITSFSGHFDGRNHTIYGLDLTEGSETIGLFQYVEEGATVCNLTVTGNISSTDSKNKLGGIAGISSGTIRNCKFVGHINGVGVSGGIVGLNGAEGVVVKCSGEGSVNSIHTVGGIVGENRGVITDCVNVAAVNAGTDWMDLESDSQVSMTFPGVWGTVKEEVEDGTDFGGIAGWSNGMIVGCENRAVVGYQHAGRNVGGIVGRQSGEVILCKNFGKVYGKQDVGGIVGQFEPQKVYEDVEELDQKVDELHDLMNRMIDDMEKMGDELHGDFQDLNKESSDASDTADALVDEMRDVIKKNVDVINELINRVDYAMTHFEVVTNYLNTALDTADEILDDLEQVKKDLSLQDQLKEDEYDEAKDHRLVLKAGIGGSLSTNNSNPAEGAKVVITIHTNPGYRLTSLTMTPYGGAAQDISAGVEGEHYVIESMPETNLTIKAVFSFVGGVYVVESNAGGNATLSSDGKTLKVIPREGYRVDGVFVKENNIYSGDEATVELPETTEGEVNKVQIVFGKVNGAHKVNIVTSTGGNAEASPQMAREGEEVSIDFTTASGYELDASSVKIKDASGNDVPYQAGLKYRFVMPAEEVNVEAAFLYHPTVDTKVYAVSNVGGSVSAVTNPTTGNANVVIRCEEGYTVDYMQVTDSADPQNTYVIDKSEMTESATVGVYTYELGTSTLTNPVKLQVEFKKNSGQYYKVSGISGVGGTIVLDKAAVKGGDTLRIAVTNELHYMLKTLKIGTGENLAAEVSDNTYEYMVPSEIAGDLEVIAEYEPVTVVFQSDRVGGSATYVVADKNAVCTITPDTGYYLESVSLVDANGTDLVCQKKYADSEVYQFEAAQLNGGVGYFTITLKNQNNKETVDASKDNLSNQSDNVVDGVNNISDVSNRIKELLTDEYGEAKNPEDLSQAELDELGELMVELMGYVSDTGVAAGGVLGNANTILQIYGPYLDEISENTSKDLDELASDARKMNDSLQGAGKELQSIVNYLNSLNKLQVVNLSDNFDKNADKLKVQLDTISSLLNRLDNHTYRHSQVLEDDMRAVNDKMNEVFTLLIDKLDNIEGLVNGEDIIEDLSAKGDNDKNVSKVVNCTNYSVVNGDRNVGGIAGCMGVEKSDSGNGDKISVGNKYAARAVLNGCVNEGFLTVKNENAGGITGKLEIGYITQCTGSGRIKSEAGNYLGGIAGYSEGTIDYCGFSGVLCGGRYIGGIAGLANTVKNCYSMVSLLKGDGWVGAIAGQDLADDDEADITVIRGGLKNRFSNNYYVGSGLYGINGVSYVGSAEPITYRELVARADAPTLFGKLCVTFLDEEENVLKRTELPYGSELGALEYPEVVTESGDYMEWDGLASNIMEGNLVIQAVSTSNVTILASEQKVDRKPLVLASGVFTEAASVQIENYEGTLPQEITGNGICHAYRVKINNTLLTEDSVTRIRLYNGERGKTSVYQLKGASWEQLPEKSLGSYEEVVLKGTEGVFCLVSMPEKNKMWFWLTIGGTTIGVVVLFILVTCARKRVKRNHVSQEA